MLLLSLLALPGLQGQSSTSLISGSGRVDASSRARLRAAGRDLFTGAAALRGRMYLHPADLPPEVVRCSNCHAVADGPAVKRSAAPRLTAGLLTQRIARRGGPPTAYDAEAFCALLRNGTDAAKVLVDVEMPRYRVSGTECAALWAYLTEPSHALE